MEGARGVDTGVQSSSPALKQKKDNKGKESEGGQPDRDAKASGTKDGPRKKKRKSEATAGSAAGKSHIECIIWHCVAYCVALCGRRCAPYLCGPLGR